MGEGAKGDKVTCWWVGKEFALEAGAGAGSQAAQSRVWLFPRVPPRQMGPDLFVPGPQPPQGQMSPRGHGQGSGGWIWTSTTPTCRRGPGVGGGGGAWPVELLGRGQGSRLGLDLLEGLGPAADLLTLVSNPAPVSRF